MEKSKKSSSRRSKVASASGRETPTKYARETPTKYARETPTKYAREASTKYAREAPTIYAQARAAENDPRKLQEHRRQLEAAVEEVLASAAAAVARTNPDAGADSRAHLVATVLEKFGEHLLDAHLAVISVPGHEE